MDNKTRPKIAKKSRSKSKCTSVQLSAEPEPFVGQIFDSFENFENFVRDYGRRANTLFVIGACKKFKWNKEVYEYISLICKRGGKPQKNPDKGIRSKVPSIKCECPVMVRAKAVRCPSSGQYNYHINKVVLQHNHEVSEWILKHYSQLQMRRAAAKSAKTDLDCKSVLNCDIGQQVQNSEILLQSDIIEMDSSQCQQDDKIKAMTCINQEPHISYPPRKGDCGEMVVSNSRVTVDKDMNVMRMELEEGDDCSEGNVLDVKQEADGDLGADEIHEVNQEKSLELSTQEGPFLCLWCDHIFLQSVDREHHMKLCHKEEYSMMRDNNHTQKSSLVPNICQLSSGGSINLASLKVDVATSLSVEDIAPSSGYYENRQDSYNNELLNKNNIEKSPSTSSKTSTLELLAASETRRENLSLKKKQKGPYKCVVCHMTFEKLKLLNLHKKSHPGARPYKCEDCGKAFVAQGVLNKHRKVHSQDCPFVCEVCGKGFKYAKSLSFHLETHVYKGPFVCEVCGKIFSKSYQLKCHLRTHSVVRPYECDLCGKMFKHPHFLNTHKQIHTKPPRHKCDICGWMWRSKARLRVHRASHINDRSFKCEICGMKFDVYDLLHKHKTSHAEEYPFRCDDCGKTFKDSSKLTIHRKIAHSL